MSRRPKPTALKELEGNPGNRALNHDEPQAQKGYPERPKGMSRLARREWGIITKQLDALGLLAVTDGKALAMYCSAYSDWEEAQRQCVKVGSWIEESTATGMKWKLAPWFQARCAAAKQMHSFLIEFGLTPASRSKLKIERVKPTAEDEATLSRSAPQPPAEDIPLPDETVIQ